MIRPSLTFRRMNFAGSIKARSSSRQSESIQWAAYLSTRADSNFAVVFGAPDESKSRLGNTGVATFPANLRDDMIDLHRDDIIRLRGVLNFNSIGNTVNLG